MEAFLSQEERFLGLDDALADPGSAGVVIVPCPFERTSTYAAGSERGPSALLEASQQIELFDCDLGLAPSQAAGGIATLAPLPVTAGDDGASVALRLEEAVGRWYDAGKFVVTLAGEHSGVVGAVRAHAERTKGLTVLQLDAHSDLRESYLDDPWNHACAMARILDFCPNLVQVGIRSEAEEERQRVTDLGVPCFYGAAVKARDSIGEDWIAAILEACGPEVYITFDLDVFDPAIMPATGTPEPGGLTWEHVVALLDRLCRERKVVGLDMSELAPIPGLHHPQFTAAKLLSRFIGLQFR